MVDKIDGLPDVDLTAVVKDLEANQKKDGKVEPQVTDLESDKLWTETFKKDPKNVIKSYRELQSAYTKTVQAGKATEQELAQLREQLELAKMQPSTPPIDPNTGLQDDTAIKFATFRIAEVLEEENNKKPNDFRERYAYAQMVSQQYPNLARSAAGVRKLFELGDKLKSDSLKQNAGKALETIFGGPLSDEETQRLVKLVKGDKEVQRINNQTNAYMPDTSTSTQSGLNQNRKPQYESQINESVKKGDVDGVIKGIFDSILAE